MDVKLPNPECPWECKLPRLKCPDSAPLNSEAFWTTCCGDTSSNLIFFFDMGLRPDMDIKLQVFATSQCGTG